MCRQNWVFSCWNWYRGNQDHITILWFWNLHNKIPLPLISPHGFRTKSSQNYKTGFSELRKEVIKRILGVVDGRLWVWLPTARILMQPLALIFSYLTFRLSGIYIQQMLWKGLKCTKSVCKYIWQSGNPPFSQTGNMDNKVLAPLPPFM